MVKVPHVLLGAALVALPTSCATTASVTSQMGQVNGKVDSVIESLEETQQQTRENQESIGLVAGRAAAARAAAYNAQQSADAAGRRAGAATRKINTLDLALRRVVYEVVLTEESGGFTFNSVVLPDAAKERLDEIVARIKANPNGAHFEIEGHTDNAGSNIVNERIGLARAEAVKRYLHERHEIPLHRLNVISYGEDRPIASNATAAGRARNRRVVLRVLV